MYFALLIAISMSAVLLLHGACSLAVLSIWRLGRDRLEAISARRATQLLLCLRMFPTVASLLALGAFVVPAFLEYEPRTTIEPVSLALMVLAVLMLAIVAEGLVRSLLALLQSRRVMRQWLHGAERQPETVQGITVYRCPLESPVIAVMGIWPTRIFAADSVYEALSREELDAALQHEAAHARSRDILKKVFLQMAPALLPGLDVLKPVTAHWSRASELAADEHAVCSDPANTLNLASALVKVARLVSVTSAELPTLSAALLRGTSSSGKESFLKYRVRRLLEISERPGILLEADSNHWSKYAAFAAGLVVLAVLVYPQALSVTHEFLEFLVQG